MGGKEAFVQGRTLNVKGKAKKLKDELEQFPGQGGHQALRDSHLFKMCR
jgi:hypothetical protein